MSTYKPMNKITFNKAPSDSANFFNFRASTGSSERAASIWWYFSVVTWDDGAKTERNIKTAELAYYINTNSTNTVTDFS